MEVAGLAVSHVLPVSIVLRTYASLLKNTSSSRIQGDLAFRLMIERARFETAIEQLSKVESQHVASELSSDIAKTVAFTIEALRLAQDRLVPTPEARGYKRSLHRVAVNQDAARKSVEEIMRSNNNLILKVQQFVSDTVKLDHDMMQTDDIKLDDDEDDEVQVSQSGTDPSVLRPESVAASLRSLAPAVKSSPNLSAMIQGLVMPCKKLLYWLANQEPDLLNPAYQMAHWAFLMKSERLYDVVSSNTLNINDVDQQDSGGLLLSVVLNMTRMLTWWADLRAATSGCVEEMRRDILDGLAAIDHVYKDLPRFPKANLGSLARLKPKGGKREREAQESVLRIVDIQLGILRRSVATLQFDAKYRRARDMEAFDAARVIQLLRHSMHLVQPATAAFDQAVARLEERQSGALAIDMGLGRKVFKRRAEELQAWDARHRDEIQTKLSQKHPAKLAVTGRAVESIAIILARLPRTVEACSNQYTGDEAPSEVRETLTGMLDELEAKVQSLVKLGSELASVDPLPPFNELARDQLLVNMDGTISQSSSRSNTSNLCAA